MSDETTLPGRRRGAHVRHNAKKRAGGTRSVPHPASEVGTTIASRGSGSPVGMRLPGSRPRIPAPGGGLPRADYSAPPRPPAICALYPDLMEARELPQAVFGQYPSALLPRVLPWLRCARHEVLHVCSGSLPPGEGIRVDVRFEARPDIIADGRALPLRDGSMAAVMLDPPYTPQYARDLYGVEYPRPSHLLREASRVVRPQGRIAFVHHIVPSPPPGCFVVQVLGLSTGFGYPMRAVTIYQREQRTLDLGGVD